MEHNGYEYAILVLECPQLTYLSVTVVSVIRLVLLLRADLVDPDITWNFVSLGILTVVEANICIVCGKSNRREDFCKKKHLHLLFLSLPSVRQASVEENYLLPPRFDAPVT